MSTTFWLTDEDSDIEGYKRAKLGSRSDCSSLVRSTTDTDTGPTVNGIQITRTSGGTALAWITDPLDPVSLTAATWAFHIWALESNAAGNAALRYQVIQFTSVESVSALLDDNVGTELGTTIKDVARTTIAATPTVLASSDRLVFKLLVDDASGLTLADNYTVRVSFNGLYARTEGDSYVICPDNITLLAEIPSTTRESLRSMLKDASVTNPILSDDELDQSITEALKTYSKDASVVATELYSGDGSTYEFTLPRLWVHGFSRIIEIEYPVGEQQRELIDPNDYEVIVSAISRQPVHQLRITGLVPDADTDNIAVRYTTPHVHTTLTDTVPSDDLLPLLWLAASYGARKMSSKMAGTTDSTLTTDTVNYRDGQQRWSSVAKDFQKMYDDYMGKSKDSTPAGATAFVDWDTQFSFGQNFITHIRQRR